MKARLKSGEIITLVKDCECLHHTQPHFLYINELDADANHGLRLHILINKQENDPQAIAGYALREQQRLQRLQYEMESRGIVELIDE